MTIGLKKLSKGSILEDTCSYLADYIFNQLSDYGKQKIRESAEQERIHFNGDYFEDEPGYRVEKTFLEHGREEKLLYLMKSGSECEICYWDEEGEKTITGKIGWDSTVPMDKTVIVKTGDQVIRIDAKKSVNIKIKNYI